MSLACLPLLPVLMFVSIEAEIVAIHEYVPVTTNPNYNHMVEALKSETELDFVDVSLEAALQQIGERHRINFVLDTHALEAAEPRIHPHNGLVSIKVSGIQLRSAFKLLLLPLGLDYIVEDEVLLVTTREKALTEQQTFVYKVAALVEEGDAQSLAEALHSALPASLRDSAGISGYRNLLLVTGNRHVHSSVHKLLQLVNDGIRE